MSGSAPRVYQDPERWAFIEDQAARYQAAHPDWRRRYCRRRARLLWTVKLKRKERYGRLPK